MIKKIRTHSGNLSSEVTVRETEHRKLSRRAAAEGFILLKNEDTLPLTKGSKVALFGSGAGQTIRGGMGSGDVNARESVSIYEGLCAAGFEITSKDWVEEFNEFYSAARQAWKKVILDEIAVSEPMDYFDVYSKNVFRMPEGRALSEQDFTETKTGIYVVSRTAGEGADRWETEGDYYLTGKEKEDLQIMNQYCEKVIVIINAGGQIDMEFIHSLEHVTAILFVVQPGMEGGNAIADVLSGDVTPSGKLTDTWAKKYMDYPSSENFSHNNGNVDQEFYTDGLYVGYRYFDSFGVKPNYAFGYGLSYTQFEIVTEEVTTSSNTISVKVSVKNTGDTYAGKEVVQIYVSCPQNGLAKPVKNLCGFAKTTCLAPGEKETLSISFPARELASFVEEKSAWIVAAGTYGIWVGNSSDQVKISGMLVVEEDVVLEEVKHICPLQAELAEISCPQDRMLAWEAAWKKDAQEKGIVPVLLAPEKEDSKKISNNAYGKAAEELVEKLTEEELLRLLVGEIYEGNDAGLGSCGVLVPGAAGETTGRLEKWNVAPVPMADGPAGLRLLKHYDVDRATDTVYILGMLNSLEGGYLMDDVRHEDADRYYQYATAFPVGTLLAQSWNMDLLEEVGKAIGAEMEEFGVGWWLAPGMNIHRNPFCGRNFEYYSEDPLVSGMAAAAITRGVQSVPGVGTTIKHFACNNMEDNRMGADSILSERTLREIYLKGFEIAVKTAQPMAIMTSYNMINGTHAANCRDINTVAVREEWDFQGVIMTDWTTTMGNGGSIPWKCVEAGNDLMMPGCTNDMINVREALAEGKLQISQVKECAARMVKVIFQTLAYEDCESYSAQFEDLKPYVQVERES